VFQTGIGGEKKEAERLEPCPAGRRQRAAMVGR
jgi:hypothetical protein